jgi:hypothetical protein
LGWGGWGSGRFEMECRRKDELEGGDGLFGGHGYGCAGGVQAIVLDVCVLYFSVSMVSRLSLSAVVDDASTPHCTIPDTTSCALTVS